MYLFAENHDRDGSSPALKTNSCAALGVISAAATGVAPTESELGVPFADAAICSDFFTSWTGVAEPMSVPVKALLVGVNSELRGWDVVVAVA